MNRQNLHPKSLNSGCKLLDAKEHTRSQITLLSGIINQINADERVGYYVDRLPSSEMESFWDNLTSAEAYISQIKAII